MKIGEASKPDRELMRLYYTYLLVVDLVIFMGVILPVVVAAFLTLSLDQVVIVSSSAIFPFLAVVFLIAFWIPKYYDSISYTFTGDEIMIERGVYWKHKSTVPYNRVTNIDIVQGPLSRRVGVGKVRVQTAGYSTASSGGATAEAQIFGVTNYEEIRDFILVKVRGRKPVAVEAEAEIPTPKEDTKMVLAELRKIRKLLEERSG
ncbi:MAG: PH domain-containing protein [Candidatus Bathyarchaeia archaeon]